MNLKVLDGITSFLKKKKNNTFLHCNASKKQNLLNIIIHKYNKIVITFLKEHDKIIVVI
jgi:hypothetical protein